MSTIVTLTTDFGTRDSYVAQVKGAILSRTGDVTLVDVTHEIPPWDIASAAMVLRDLPASFPVGTIHLAVIDPGVGGTRPLIAFEAAGQRFVGPDNGLWSAVARRFPPTVMHRLENSRLWADRVSPTFHGRDIMAPVVAFLARGGALVEVGPVYHGALTELSVPHPRVTPHRASGVVTAIDRFGNLLTNIELGLVEPFWPQPKSEWIVQIGQQRIDGVRDCYVDVESGDLLALVSSQGELEIAVRDGNAADELGVAMGQSVILVAGN